MVDPRGGFTATRELRIVASSLRGEILGGRGAMVSQWESVEFGRPESISSSVCKSKRGELGLGAWAWAWDDWRWQLNQFSRWAKAAVGRGFEPLPLATTH
jgi:hypothetical protein